MNHFHPNMNKPKAIALLKRARELIKSDQKYLICYAIDRAECETVGNGQSHYLKEWIQSMLGTNYTYSEWVRRTHPHLFEGLTTEQIMKKTKEGRLAWIDWMIQEVQK